MAFPLDQIAISLASNFERDDNTPTDWSQQENRDFGSGSVCNCVFFPRESVKGSAMSSLNPMRSSNSRTKSGPPSDVTRDQSLEIDLQRGVERELKELDCCSRTGCKPPEYLLRRKSA